MTKEKRIPEENSPATENDLSTENCYLHPDPNNRCEDRRKNRSEGYMWISTVGWICRREKTRRKDDKIPE